MHSKLLELDAACWAVDIAGVFITKGQRCLADHDQRYGITAAPKDYYIYWKSKVAEHALMRDMAIQEIARLEAELEPVRCQSTSLAVCQAPQEPSWNLSSGRGEISDDVDHCVAGWEGHRFRVPHALLRSQSDTWRVGENQLWRALVQVSVTYAQHDRVPGFLVNNASDARSHWLHQWNAQWDSLQQQMDKYWNYTMMKIGGGQSSIPGMVRIEVIDHWRRVRYPCAICRESLHVDERPHLDHRYPRFWGGAAEVNNLRVVHARCNSRRGEDDLNPWLHLDTRTHIDLLKLMSGSCGVCAAPSDVRLSMARTSFFLCDLHRSRSCVEELLSRTRFERLSPRDAFGLVGPTK